MAVFESFLALLLAAVLLAAAARRFGAPYPAFLALGGIVLAFVPGVPPFVLEPDLALALFVAPVLLDAAFDSSPRDLRDNWAPLLGLGGTAGSTSVQRRPPRRPVLERSRRSGWQLGRSTGTAPRSPLCPAERGEESLVQNM